MRGRLIQRFLAELARLDTSATRSAGGYDDDFREVTRTDSDGDGIGDFNRQEHAAIMVPCQVNNRTWEGFHRHDLGQDPKIDLVLIFHFDDLERMGLVQSSGIAAIHVGDRLVSIRDIETEEVVQTVRNPPGLYVIEATPGGWGLNLARPTRNLLRVKLGERPIV